MFENLVGQDASQYISSDIRKGTFPGAVLFSGNNASGKLTAALETARVLSCVATEKRGSWNCTCPSCLRHKALNCTNVLLMGPRECFLEIEAAKSIFIKAYMENASFLVAARYLYLRSVRKLTLRFSGILYQGENNLNKIGTLISEINENMEKIDFPYELPSKEEIEQICEEINKLALELESEYLYNSIPINQVRNMEEWAHIRPEEGKKVIIIENADRMQNNVRNALLKILEEPPADCIFILLTSRRNAVLPTILSRVRTYNFKDRTLEVQNQVIKRVFHNDAYADEISEYLLTYLPVPAEKIRQEAEKFIENIVIGKIPDVPSLIKDCGKFEPKIELKIFLQHLCGYNKKLLKTNSGCEASAELIKVIQNCYDNCNSYNQSVQQALETLIRDIARINIIYERVISQSLK